MKSGLIVLFSFLLCVSFTLKKVESVKFEYTTISKSVGDGSTKLVDVISSHKTPLVLKSSSSDRKVEVPNKYKGYSTVKYTETEKNSKDLVAPIITSKRSTSNVKQDEVEIDAELQSKINDSSNQTVSKKEAFNAYYPDVQAYKDDLKVKIYDDNYDAVKSGFFSKMNKILDEKLLGNPVEHVSKATKKLKLAVNVDASDFPKVDPEELNSKKANLKDDNSYVKEFSA